MDHEATDAVPAAIVLVGGRSTRMGTDKASLVVDGMAMVDRVLVALAEVGITEVAVAGGSDVVDPEPAPGHSSTQGPMAGIVGGWRHLRQRAPAQGFDPIVVLSCDLPSLGPNVVQQLVDTSRSHLHGAVAHDGERPQPLVAAYRRRSLDAFEAAFDAGERSVRRSFDGWDLGVVRFDSVEVTDADTPEDLRGFAVEWPR
jgi:molybdopterin-guanine dinucleotide biosynthesis protein A